MYFKSEKMIFPGSREPLLFLFYLFVVLYLLLVFSSKGASRPISRGEEIYQANCQSCHRMGRNPLKPEKHLAESSKLVSEGVFAEYLSEKHGLMPKFNKISDNENELRELFAFSKTLKDQSWEYPLKGPGPQDLPMRESKPKNNPL